MTCQEKQCTGRIEVNAEAQLWKKLNEKRGFKKKTQHQNSSKGEIVT